MIIIHVTNKVLIYFVLPKETLLDTNTFTISTSFIKEKLFHNYFIKEKYFYDGKI